MRQKMEGPAQQLSEHMLLNAAKMNRGHISRVFLTFYVHVVLLEEILCLPPLYTRIPRPLTLFFSHSALGDVLPVLSERQERRSVVVVLHGRSVLNCYTTTHYGNATADPNLQIGGVSPPAHLLPPSRRLLHSRELIELQRWRDALKLAEL